jgi:uncharacterized DUF497 family protein
MVTEWDPAKARLNYRKHRVSFADAVPVLEDEAALTMRLISARKATAGERSQYEEANET